MKRPRNAKRALAGPTTLIAGLVFGAVLGGCSGVETSRVSILNESESGLRYAAWVQGDPVPSPSGDELIAANSSAGTVLEHEGVDRPAVEVRIRREGDGRDATVVRMQPPGPYLLRVRDVGDQLSLLRIEDRGPSDGMVPTDPHQRGLTDDIPRPNTNFQRP